MKLIVSDKQKRDIFLALFQILKGCTSLVTIFFNDDHIYIQGMDKAHICLFDMKIMKEWFDHYEINASDMTDISIDTTTFHTILNMVKDDQSITIFYEGHGDNLDIELTSVSKLNYDKYFSIPLADMENDLLNVPDTDYDAEFSINSKKICEMTAQMICFGSDIRINCGEEKINLSTQGVLGDMLVTIPLDDLNEYSISEDETVDLLYSLSFLHKMCLTTKLSANINFAISKNYPMRIAYDLGDDSKLLFYLAPKIE
jgi:proliferating cell nuclear antigen PCNA